MKYDLYFDPFKPTREIINDISKKSLPFSVYFEQDNAAIEVVIVKFDKNEVEIYYDDYSRRCHHHITWEIFKEYLLPIKAISTQALFFLNNSREDRNADRKRHTLKTNVFYLTQESKAKSKVNERCAIYAMKSESEDFKNLSIPCSSLEKFRHDDELSDYEYADYFYNSTSEEKDSAYEYYTTGDDPKDTKSENEGYYYDEYNV